MRKLVTSLAIVAAMITVMAIGSGTARAIACTVPVDHPTIQSAVNDLTCTQINVLPGVYNENVLVFRTVLIYGAQAGVPASGRVGPESVVQGANPVFGNAVFRISAFDVVVDGFTIKNAITTGAATGIEMTPTGGNALIIDNIVDGVTTTDITSQGAAQGIYLQNGPDGVAIVDNDIKNVHSPRSAKGVHIGDASSTNSSIAAVIVGNTIENITSDVRGAYGISVNNGNGATANTGILIEDNIISTLTGGGWVHAIGLEANTPSVSVQRNSINPLITGSLDAIAVWFEANPSFSTAKVNENNFNVTNAAYGIAVQPTIPGTGSVDGTCNWWGAPDGPGPIGPSLIGAKVTPRVDYTPWLTAPFPIGACLGGQPSTEGKVTGGGQIEGDPLFSPLGELLSLPALMANPTSPNGRATFGFNAKCCDAAGNPSGNLQYNDHDADVRIKARTVEHLEISSPGAACPTTPGSRHAQFTGMAWVTHSNGTPNDEPYTVDVDDCGEPGTMDTFGIRATTYVNYPPKTLLGGNIQIHD